MPEMPEIQAHAERLMANFEGAELASFRPLHLTALKTFDPRPETAVGQPLTSTGRRGKYLLMGFGSELTFVVHLMQAGRLRPDPKQAAKPRGGMARWTFSDGGALLLTEAGTERKAGVWLRRGDVTNQEPLDHLGPEADQISADELAMRLGAKGRRLHGFLRDQRELAGVGRLLANEICFHARLSPFVSTKSLKDEAMENLRTVISATIATATDHERTLDDIGKAADRPTFVHNRIGEPCIECDDTIRSVEYRRYTVAYCPTHQTDGKILADNTTSKFLK